jgi:hypothetical protein
VEAIVEWCAKRPELVWLGHVIIALACTGLRISELASLRWTDLDHVGGAQGLSLQARCREVNSSAFPGFNEETT